MVAIERSKKKMNSFLPNRIDASFEVIENQVLIKRLMPNKNEEVKEESLLPDLEFDLEEYPEDLPDVLDPSADFYKEEVFESTVFRQTDSTLTGVKPEEINVVIETRVHRAWERKLGMPIVKDNVHHLVDYFEDYVDKIKSGMGTKIFKQYIV